MKRFQARHGLENDGVLGQRTHTALGIPLAWRIRQIELALERVRWLPHPGGERVVAISIPMFRLWAWGAMPPTRTPTLSMGVIVGRALRTETPVFVEQMREVIFRPYWNVPPSIARHEILPILERDPDYLRRQGMEIVSGPGDDARAVAATAENLARLRRGALRLRQRPGPRNALGLVKFVFPNQENVYMHGTPAQELFSRSRRDFSHGCVRVEDPVALAEWVLEDRPEWTRDRIIAAMAGNALAPGDAVAADSGDPVLHHCRRDGRWDDSLCRGHLSPRRAPRARAGSHAAVGVNRLEAPVVADVKCVRRRWMKDGRDCGSSSAFASRGMLQPRFATRPGRLAAPARSRAVRAWHRRRVHRATVDRSNDVADGELRLLRRAIWCDVDDQAPSTSDVLGLLAAVTSPSVRPSPLSPSSTGTSSRSSAGCSSIVAVRVCGLPSRKVFRVMSCPAMPPAVRAIKSRVSATGVPSISTITSPARRPARSAAEPVSTIITIVPFAAGKRSSFASSSRIGPPWSCRPSWPRTTLPAQLRQQGLHRVDGYGEPDPGSRAAVAVDHGDVHADDFTANVEQRAAGVSEVDRRIGLNQVLPSSVVDLDGTPRKAHHADRHAVPELKWVTDGHHPVARLEGARIAERRRLKVGWRALQSDQGAVCLRIAADPDRTISFPIVPEQTDFDVAGTFDDVTACQNVAGAADEEPGGGGQLDMPWRTELEHSKDLAVVFSPAPDP